MALNVGTLSGILELDSKPFDQSLDQSGSKMSALTGVAKKAALGAGVALAGIGAKGLMSFAGFDRQMREVFTLLPDISAQAMADMTGQVKDFSAEFGVLPDKVVPALYQSISAGVPPGNVFEFLETAQKAAKGGVTELETAVDGISSVVNAYGSDVLGAAKASDLMFTAVKLGKTNFEELSASLFNVTPTAAALGVKFEDLTGALASMTAQGVPTSVATTQLRQMFVELSKEGSKTSDTFKEIAGKSFKQFVAEGGNTQQALALLAEHADKTGIGVNDLFGSVEAGAAALALSGKNADKYAENLAAMGSSAGATDKAFGTMNRGIGATFDRLKAKVSVALIDLGDRLAPTVERIVGFVVDNMPKVEAVFSAVGRGIGTVARFVKRNEGPLKALAALIAAVLIPHYVALGVQATISAGKQVVAWAMTKGAAAGAMLTHSAHVVAMAARWAFLGVQSLLHAGKVAAAWLIAIGPIAIVAAAVVGLAVLIVKHWDKIKAFLAATWNAIKGAAAATWDAIVAVVTGAWDLMLKAAGTVFDALKAYFEFVFGIYRSIIVGTWTAIRTVVEGIWNGLKRVAETVFGAVRSIVETEIRGVKTVIDTVLRVVKIIWEGIWGGVRTFFSTVWNGIKRVVKAAVEFILDQIDRLLGPLDEILGKVGGLAGKAGGLLGKGASFVGNAFGGVFDSGGVVPGPRGMARLVVAHAGETILPTHKGGFGVGGSATVRVVVPLYLDGRKIGESESVIEGMNSVRSIRDRNTAGAA